MNIRGRLFDFSSDAIMGGGDFLINSTTSFTQSAPVMHVSKSKAVVVWTSAENGGLTVIRGATLTLPNVPVEYVGPIPYGANNFFTSPLIERNYDTTIQILK
jgi:hypothetical protein